MADDKETVTLKLPNGDMQDFIVPSGMSSTEIKAFVFRKRPDLFKTAPSTGPTAAPVAPVPIPAGLQNTERAMQQTMGGPPMFTDVPKGTKQQFEQAGQKGYATGAKVGMALNAIPSAIAAPAATGVALAGGTAGGLAGRYGAQKGAEALGAAPDVAETVGDIGEVAGGLAGGGLAAKSPLAKWIGASRTVGAQMLQQASAKAGNAPVELSPKTDELVEQIVKQSKLGGKAPKVISDLLERVGPSVKNPAEAEPGPLTYDEARILQSNISELSAAEKMDLKGQLKFLMPQLAKSFSADVQAAANKAGVGVEHATGMSEYAAASVRGRMLSKAGKTAGIGGGGALGLYELLKLIKP